MADYSTANRIIAYTLGRGRAYISDMSSTSVYMGAKYLQDFGSDVSSASGYMGAHYLLGIWSQIFGVSCSKCCASWRVNIYPVNKFPVVSARP